MTTRFSSGLLAVLALLAGVGTVAPRGLSAAQPTSSASPRAIDSTGLDAAVAARLDVLDRPALDTLYGPTPRALWVEDGALRARGTKAMAELRGAVQRGLPRGRYDVRRVRRLSEADDPSVETLAELDVAISTGMLRLVRDVAGGVLPAEGFDPGWRIDSRDTPRVPGADSAAASPAAILAELDRVTPGSLQAQRLPVLLQRLRALRDSGGWTRLPEVDGTVAAGDSADIVLRLRERLRQSLSPVERRLAREGGLDARYDSALAESVEHFQSRHGIAVDGVLGPDTHRELNAPVEQRIAAVRVALERWRWLPARLGTDALPASPAILVNTAGRRVHVLEEGRPVLSMKAIVGRRDWKTTLFEDAMERLVVNPYWNVPENIVREETLPKAADDPDYLRRNAFEVVDSEGGIVPLDAIDWSGVEAATFPHRIRQRPGDANALGRVKFLFPNRFAIYLHDTPAGGLFDSRLRTFSHGCIRVERPAELAQYLLRTATDEPSRRYDEMKRSGARHVVELDETIPTYVVYQTVRVDADGLPTFAPDVYRRDQRVLDALSRLERRASASEDASKVPAAPESR